MTVVGIVTLDEGGAKAALDHQIAHGGEDGKHGHESIVVGAEDVGYHDDHSHLQDLLTATVEQVPYYGSYGFLFQRLCHASAVKGVWTPAISWD